jgi:DNA-binding MarR family transcriptional regulator
MRGNHVATTNAFDAQQTVSKTYDRRMALVEPELERPSWTFLTNHAHVMVALSRDAELRQRDLAYVIGITPGAVQRILDDLERAGYVKREKVGRRNRYEVLTSESLRHPLEQGHNIGELLEMLHD